MSDPKQIGLNSLERQGEPAAGVVVGAVRLVIRSLRPQVPSLSYFSRHPPASGVPCSRLIRPGRRSRRNAIGLKSRYPEGRDWASKDVSRFASSVRAPKLFDFPGYGVS